VTEAHDTVDDAIRSAVDDIRSIAKDRGINRSSLAEIAAIVVSLSARSEFADADLFPGPEADARAVLYLLNEDPDHTNALYLLCAAEGNAAPPHDHATWAAIAGVAGVEENRTFERVTEVTTQGPLRETGHFMVGPGDGLSMMTEDLHSIRCVSEGGTRHLHMYGTCFDQLPQRVMLDPQSGTFTPLPTDLVPIDVSRRVL
jgi:predicted metal-dependent enzyme (double-stranded beta helix superfamily)